MNGKSLTLYRTAHRIGTLAAYTSAIWDLKTVYYEKIRKWTSSMSMRSVLQTGNVSTGTWLRGVEWNGGQFNGEISVRTTPGEPCNGQKFYTIVKTTRLTVSTCSSYWGRHRRCLPFPGRTRSDKTYTFHPHSTSIPRETSRCGSDPWPVTQHPECKKAIRRFGGNSPSLIEIQVKCLFWWFRVTSLDGFQFIDHWCLGPTDPRCDVGTSQTSLSEVQDEWELGC